MIKSHTFEKTCKKYEKFYTICGIEFNKYEKVLLNL